MDKINGSNAQSNRTLARQRFRSYISLIVLIGLVFSSAVPLMDSNAATQSSEIVLAGTDPVIAAAGDIACDPTNSHFLNGLGDSNACRQKYTSDLLVNQGLAAVLDLGDNQYYCGGYQAFLQSYDLSWGRVKSITHPSVGNHEYLTSGGTDCTISNEGATGYFNYFGSAAGTPGQGYYSFDVGAWHIIALNSNCTDAGGCGPGTPQYVWLQNDLTAHSNFCTLAYWHIPLYSSGGRAANNTQAFWQLLYNNNADLILNGHDHIYERFAPQDPIGALDNARGMREFIIGTGGSDHTNIPGAIAANSQVRNIDTYGIIKLTLHSTSYDWQFVPEAGKTFTDSGTGACHGNLPDTTPPSAPTNLTATSVAWNQVNLSWTASTDNVAVVGYQIFRNGAQIATTSAKSYTDGTVLAQTTYSYYVKAVDGVGLTSNASNTISVTTPVAPAILTFAPIADTYVQSDVPSSNFGTSTQFVTDSSPVRNMFIKFTVSGVGTQNILSVKLRLYCVDPSPYGGEFHRVADTSWSETGVNWNNAPPADSTVLATLGKVVAATWYEVNVTPLVTGDGTFSLRINSSNSDGAYYSTKEGTAGFAPQLVVSTSATSITVTPTTTPTSTATATPTTQSGFGFSDGFESGNLSSWTSGSGLVVQTQEVATGNYAARGTSTAGGATYARKLLSAPQSDIYYRIRLKVISQGANNVSLMKFRTAADISVLSVGINSLGQISYHNDITGTSAASTTVISQGSWQTLQVHVHIADTASQVEVWYNDALVSALSRTDSLGTNPIGILQLGENTPALTYDLALDDVAASLSYIATVVTPTPTVTATITATITSTLTSTPTPTSAPISTSTPTPTGTLTSTSTLTATPSTAPSVLTFTAIADTYVQSDTPTTNYGSSTQFVTDNSPIRQMLLKFSVSGIGVQPIVSAKLRIYCVDPSPFGGEFHRVADNNWSEGTVNWNTAPAADATILASLGKVSASTWYEVDVTSLINGDGTYSVKIISSNSDGAYYSTKEGTAGFAPQLVVRVNPVANTATPTGTATPTVAPSNTPTSTGTATVTATPTPAAASSNTPTTTVTATATVTPTQVFASSDTPTATATGTATVTATPTATFTPTAQASIIFSDGFESGDLANWTTVQGLIVQNQEFATGVFAARGTSTAGGATYARKLLTTPQSDIYYRIRFKVLSQAANTVNLLKFRTAPDVSILSVSINNLGQLSYRNDLAGTSVNSSVSVSQGSWQTLQVHVHIADTASQIEVWYNDALVGALTQTDALGVNPIGRLQLGENTGGLTYDIAFDGVIAATSFITSDTLP